MAVSTQWMEALDMRMYLTASAGPVALAAGLPPSAVMVDMVQAKPAHTRVTIAPSRVVSIPDANLRVAILQALHRSSGEITAADMLSLTSLSAMHNQDSAHAITDLTGMEYAKNLTYLNLNWNRVADLGPLQELVKLTTLHLYENAITDIGPLRGLTQLEHLDLGLDHIQDISPLTGMTRMVALNLHNNKIPDVTALSGMTALRKLKLQACGLTSLNGLEAMTHLKLLDVQLNQLNTNPDSAAMRFIAALEQHGTQVSYLPQGN